VAGVSDASPSPAAVLVLNAGSSSLKASLIELPDRTLGRTETSWGSDATGAGDRLGDLRAALERLGLDALTEGDDGAGGARTSVDRPTVAVVGHRVVHGGPRFTEAARLDAAVLGAVREVSALAPLHNGVALEAIEAAMTLLPDVPHVACFDTAFHATLPEEGRRYPVPERWHAEWGIHRYGFHGLSVAWSARRAAALLGRPVDELALVVAHLGSGCSATAVLAGRSVDTSMGLTPLEGLMMGTRSGSIDPGILLRLLREGLASTEELGEALDHRSGLLGVSGLSGDVRQLTAAARRGDERAALALRMFARRAAAGIAAAASSLPRLDAIVFTGGIGEHAAGLRGEIAERLAVLGVELPGDPPEDGSEAPAGDGADRVLSVPGARVALLRITAREDLVIAQEAIALASR
jgi:acetate kinase